MMSHILKLLRHKWYFLLMMKRKVVGVFQHLKPRDLYDMGENDEDTVLDIEAYPSQILDNLFPDGKTHLQLSRDDVDDPNDTQMSYIGEHFEAENDN